MEAQYEAGYWDSGTSDLRVACPKVAVIGSEGFGFIETSEGHLPMPQIGKVVIENEVRIGANCTIDRSTL